MGLFDKLKNVFTEEVEEEPIKKEVRQVEIKGPTEVENEVEEVKKEEKFVFPVYFDDKDFDELKPKEPPKKEIPKKETYGIKNKEVKVEKKFIPSPVISPVYGVLDKNYNKEDVKTRKVTRTEYRSSTSITLDDVRKKAYGSLEDGLANSLFADDPIYIEKEVEYVETTPTEMIEEKLINDYKPELIEELDQNMTLDELNKLEDNQESENSEEINMNESDLFNLIDSMYEKSDEDDNK